MQQSVNPDIRNNIGCSHEMPKPTAYVNALLSEYSDWAFDETRAPSGRGGWRLEVFKETSDYPLDLEIGTGNGYFFAYQCTANPERGLVGIEKKYKPLIQSIRRARKVGATNARGVRYDARFVTDLFEKEELDDVYIHFPDPWLKKRWNKNRLIQTEFLNNLFDLQKPGSKIDFKTDSREYFDWAVERFKKSKYQVTGITYDLHNSEWAGENFVTHFERIFLKKSQPIHFIRLIKK